MPKFRKKPVVIDAVLWTGNLETFILPDWFPKIFEGNNTKETMSHGVINAGTVWLPEDSGMLVIGTLEGSMTANAGDYIIKGIAGEIYPCKPEIFEQTYDLVEE